METELMEWLLSGDVSIQYQVFRDLLDTDRGDLHRRIATEGWGARFLSCRNPDGHWGRGFYQPKWTCSHYTLLDLKNLQISPRNALIQQSINKIVTEEKGPDGGVNPSRSLSMSDVCVNGMFLNYACYFQTGQQQLHSIVDFILSQHMPDGGFNCKSTRGGAVHSSLHTSLSVLEGFAEYRLNGYTYRLDDIRKAGEAAREFILLHQLFISDRTGEVINKNFLRLSYPCRWYYDILRALDYFRATTTPWDPRLEPAIEVLLQKRSPKNGSWKLQARHPGQVHFDMEAAGRPSRWNSLRALRVLRHFGLMHF